MCRFRVQEYKNPPCQSWCDTSPNRHSAPARHPPPRARPKGPCCASGRSLADQSGADFVVECFARGRVHARGGDPTAGRLTTAVDCITVFDILLENRRISRATSEIERP